MRSLQEQYVLNVYPWQDADRVQLPSFILLTVSLSGSCLQWRKWCLRRDAKSGKIFNNISLQVDLKGSAIYIKKDILKCLEDTTLTFWFVGKWIDFWACRKHVLSYFVDKSSVQQQQILPDPAVGRRQLQDLQCVDEMGQRWVYVLVIVNIFNLHYV